MLVVNESQRRDVLTNVLAAVDQKVHGRRTRHSESARRVRSTRSSALTRLKTLSQR